MDFPTVPAAGVWCPAVTLFDPDTDELPLEDQARYYAHLSRTGLAGLVVLGTNAETFLLTREERRALVACARAAVGPAYPLMAGVGGHSTRQVLEFVADAAAAGANYALLLPPAYFGAPAPAVLDGFFADVARASPLPIVVYNFPAVCNGADLSSAAIAALARRHPGKIVGTKLTCGSVAKITRLAAELPPEEFAVFGGQSDFLLGGLAVGSAGCIAAFANVFPRTIVRIYNLWKEGKAREALELHRRAALAEQPCKGGIAVTKYAAALFSAPRAGVADAVAKMRPRRPYLEPAEEVKRAVREAMADVAAVEDGLAGAGAGAA